MRIDGINEYEISEEDLTDGYNEITDDLENEEDDDWDSENDKLQENTKVVDEQLVAEDSDDWDSENPSGNTSEVDKQQKTSENQEKNVQKTSETTKEDNNDSIDTRDIQHMHDQTKAEKVEDRNSDNQESKDSEAKEIKPLIDDERLKIYIKDIENQTKREIPNVQKNKIEDVVHTQHFEKLSPEETRVARSEFNSQKSKLISDWEANTGQRWPTYEEDVVNERGAVLRREGSNYDAHHVIECSYGGPSEWWNITPARFPTEHQQGIHRKDSPASEIFA